MSFLEFFDSQTLQVSVDTSLRDGGFRLTYPGLLGRVVKTNAAVTQRILQSPDFESLFAAEKSVRILEIVLASATEPYSA